MIKKLNLIQMNKEKEELFKKDLALIQAGAIDPHAKTPDDEDKNACSCENHPLLGSSYMSSAEGKAANNLGNNSCSCSTNWWDSIFSFWGLSVSD